MRSKLKSLFGLGPDTDFAALLRQTALRIEVRTEPEFRGGHINGARKIPLDRLHAECTLLPRTKPIIVYCASGMRSATARKLLEAKGFTQDYNGGGWQSLQNKLNS
ncbi:rhodanese-like domain-containing protein [Flaviaesturariibacter terrae]